MTLFHTEFPQEEFSLFLKLTAPLISGSKLLKVVRVYQLHVLKVLTLLYFCVVNVIVLAWLVVIFGTFRT